MVLFKDRTESKEMNDNQINVNGDCLQKICNDDRRGKQQQQQQQWNILRWTINKQMSEKWILCDVDLFLFLC